MNISFALFVIFTAFAPKTKTRGVAREPTTGVRDSQPKDQGRNYLWHGLWTRAGNKPKAPQNIAQHWATLKDQRMIQHSFSVIGDNHFEPLGDYGLLFDPLKLNDKGKYSAEIIAACSEDMHYPVDMNAEKKFEKHIQKLLGGKDSYPAVAPDYCDGNYISMSDRNKLGKMRKPIKEVVDFSDTNPREEKDSRTMILQHILEMSETNRHNETIANIDIKDALGIGYKTSEGKQKAELLQKALLEKKGISLECIDLTKLQPSKSKSHKRKN